MLPSPSPSSALPLRPQDRGWLAAVVAVSAVLAVWMDLSPLHRFHDSDSLVPVLMSLQRWTPFYWEQNRFGMLVPLLALPVRAPFHNLLVQVALRLFAVALSFFLVARMAVPRPYWPAVGAVTLLLFITGKGLFAHCFSQMQPYPQAAALALAGVAVLEGAPPGRRGAVRRGARVGTAALLLGLAFWVSVSLVFWLLALLLLRRVLLTPPSNPPASFLSAFSLGRWRPLSRGKGGRWERGSGGEVFLPFALVCAGFAASLLFSKYAAWGGTDLGAEKAAAWPHGWATLARQSARFLGVPLVLAAGVLAGSSAAWLVRRSARARLAASSGLCLLGAAAAELLALGTSAWVHLNFLTIRFLWCGLLAAATALPAMTAVLLLEGRERWHRAVNAAALLALVPALLLRFGAPSPAAARAAFDRHVGPAGPAVAAAGCTHVIGSYWRVWPAVLRIDEILWEQGAARQVWGLTTRSRPTRDLWQPRSWRAARVAVLGGDAVAPTAMSFYRVPPLFLTATVPGARIYSGAPPPGTAVVSFPPLVRSSSEGLPAPSQETRR